MELLLAVSFWISLHPLLTNCAVHRRFDNPKSDLIQNGEDGIGLFPRIFNLAKHAEISTNATCGLERPEVFCRRPLDKEGKRQNRCNLTICDGKKNGIRKALDGSKDSWISPTLEKGLEYEHVTIRLDMKQVYQVVYVTLKSGIAPRPAAWVLERSIDGVTYHPWQYFAENDSECRQRYGLPATHGKPYYKTDNEVICTIFYSKLYPLENGEIHVSLLNGRPGLNTSSDALRNFTLARYVRFRFQKIHKTDRDHNLRKKLFYSVRTISIGGQCLCHGHASKCTTNSVSGMPSCECEHHTCGKSCSECCPLFNQQPWRPGTLESAGLCESCQCFGHAMACRYNEEIASAKLSLNMKGEYRGGGECIDCRDHTTGVNCERCEKGWYRPLGVQPDDPSPCLPCDCHPEGSIGTCVRDDSEPGMEAGSCHCREGYAGIKCGKCASGYTNFPNCEECSCDVRGTIAEENCTHPCRCKDNVEGERCDRCKPGFFALSADNPQGCTKCYCSGVSNTCEELRSNRTTTVSSLDGWSVTDLSTTKRIVPVEDPDTNTLYVANYELPGVESFYWTAPASLTGDQIGLYGEMSLEFDVGWEAMRGDTSGQPTVGPNIVLVGRNGLRLGHGDEVFDSRKGNASLRALLIEDSWYLVPSEMRDIRTRSRRTDYRGGSVSRDQFLSVLADLEFILLRASFHTDQAEGSLLSVKLEPITLRETNHHRERCVCPKGYSGPSCERCAFSFYKDGNSSADSHKCLPCACNGHSECDPKTGICEKCQHNTQGDQCQFCLDGFYGDATVGAIDDCKPCACPLLHPDNNFTPFCEIKNSKNPNETEYVCSDCPSGYAGDHCEMCDDFYYGNPLELGSSCQPCDCKGGLCHNLTGHCLDCEGNTMGLRCENCKYAHYGDPLRFNCKPCNCDLSGSVSEVCDLITGQCPCKDRFVGRACDRCGFGYGNVTADCAECDCGIATADDVCDPVTGSCSCAAGALQPKCDECEPEHFGLSSDGCTGCGCHVLGSVQAACDIVTGQCQCKPNVTGRACDQCQDRHWGLFSSAGCRPCDCDATGSVSENCDIHTGQCQCKPGVGGLRCDSCLPNHYGFSRSGCLKCQECNLLGHVCDPETGRCVCPPYTYGVHCQLCAPNAWGYRMPTGCTPCDCHSGGSERSQCDPRTGECICRKGFVGAKCDSCDRGYHSFPFCKSCDCNPAGTEERNCDPESGNCQCDENGTCPCKPNVTGKKCETCKSGTFGLERANPTGCIACFCFGRSASCTQAGLHWTQIRSGRPRSVLIEYDPSPPFKNTLPIDTQEICYINLAIPGGGEVVINGADRGLNVTNNLRIIPGGTEDVKIGVSFLFDTPVYWRLPEQFLGDKVLSYGGYLRFFVETVGGHTQLPPFVLSTYPLVQLQGNNKIILEHFPVIPSQTGRYAVRFHESLWEDKLHPDRKVTRETLMVALQNVQHILIRGSDSVDFTKITLKDVSMDTAAASKGLSLAGAIELCECPPEYNSTSCQNPSIGFYRWHDKNISTATILIQLVGEARPCQCSNRSTVCDIETGHCLNCANNTGGPNCEHCGPGYYGEPTNCKSCPCPTPERNFAVSCRVTPKDAICHCKEGYAGKYCDRCAYGWFGYPEREGGSCQPCECNPFGSVSDECDEKTGQCNCRPGIEGKDCSICPQKQVLTPKGCSTCEDGCTGILLKDFNELSKFMEKELFNVITTGEPPWKSLMDIQNRLSVLEDDYRKIRDLGKDLKNREEKEKPLELLKSARNLKDQALVLQTVSKDIRSGAVAVKNEAVDTLARINKIKADIEETVMSLSNYSSINERMISDSVALLEGKVLLNRMKARNFTGQEDEAERVLDYCTGILNKTLHMNEHFPEMRFIRKESHTLLAKLKDLESKVLQALDWSQKQLEQSMDQRKRLKSLIDKVEKIRSSAEDANALKEEANNIIELAEKYLKDVQEGIQNLTSTRNHLKNSSEILSKKTGILGSLNPLYREMYLKPAIEHANELQKIAEGYRDMFNSTRKDTTRAVEAGKAYQDIVDVLKNVTTAANEAKKAADESYKKMATAEKDDTLIDKSKISREESEDLKEESSDLLESGKSLKERLNREKESVEQLKKTVRVTGVEDNKLADGLQKLKDMKVDEGLANAMEKTEDLNLKLKEVKNKVNEVNMKIVHNLRPQLQNNTAHGKKQGIEKARENIQDSLQNHREAMNRLNHLDSLGQERNTQAGDTSLKNVLTNLHHKLTEARHAAESIRLPLTSNSTRGCVRSFTVPSLESTTTTRLVITLTVNPLLRNGVIFYVPSSTSVDFMGVELVDGFVRFVWNNGGGPGVVWKALNGNSKNSGGNSSRWYKIVVERIGYTARLWVIGEGMTIENVPPAVNSSSPNFGRLDLGPSDKVWVGGLPPGSETPSEILSLQQGLIGCLHGIILDDRPIGLWNYYTDSTDSCSACERSVVTRIDGSKYSFNGEGYSVLKPATKTVYNKYQFSAALKFKTFDYNALLFLAVSSDKTRFISLSLRDGRVVFQIGYGRHSQLEMSTTRRYNDGNWTTVEASRNFDKIRNVENGLLKVSDELKEAAPPVPPARDQIPELATADYLVGGIPPGYDLSSLNIRFPKSFLGCMYDLFVDNEIYNPLKGRRNGLRPSCSDQVIKTAGFRGEGYLKLEASRLKKDSAFGLALRTLQPDALVLLANGKSSRKDTEGDEDSSNDVETGLADKKESYYSISLVDGRAEVRIDAGKGPVTLVSQTVCNDGRFHSISVVKTGRKLELRVDDELQATSQLPGRSVSVKAKDLYIGGVPEGMDVSQYVSHFTPFVGTIKDVLFNYVVQKFDNPISFVGVDIGRLGPEKQENVTANSNASSRHPHQNHSECHRSRKYVLDPRAVKFGDSRNSHVQVHVRRRGIFQKNYNIELDFRTFHENGLIFLIPGTSKTGRQKHFISATLKKGLLITTIKAKRKLEQSSAFEYADGNWHHILISREDRKMLLLIDSKDPQRIKLPKKVNLGNSVFIGGVPDSGILPENLLAKIGGFTGCMRNLKISNQTEELIGEKSIHHGVGQCFPQVEKGSYFSGDAYVFDTTEVEIFSLLKIEIEFRTSEMSGILLTVSNPGGYPAFSLEINNGKIILSGVIKQEEKFRLVHEFPSKYSVCDNKWHRIDVMYEGDELIMRVDHSDLKKEMKKSEGLKSLVSAHIHIGGLPDHLENGKPIAETRDNFKGCIRSFAIGEERKDFTEMDVRHNVLIGSCPIVNHH